MAKATIARAVASERLHPVHPGVYCTLPPSMMQLDHRLAAAVLAGGRHAGLCADSAAHWAGALKTPPSRIHVAVENDHLELPGVRFHRLKLTDAERITHRGMPMTALERIPLDLAATHSLWELKGVLAELEYHHDISPDQLTLRRGYNGTARLRLAIAQHTPQLAETRSHLEQTFVRFLTERGFALPSFNAAVGLSTVDATYEDLRLVIELDGVKGHSGERRILRDHRRDLHRRREGFTAVRYHFAQLTADADLVEAELDRLGVPRIAWRA